MKLLIDGVVEEGCTSLISDVDDTHNEFTFTYQWQISDTAIFDSNSNISGNTFKYKVLDSLPQEKKQISRIRLTMNNMNINATNQQQQHSPSKIRIDCMYYEKETLQFSFQNSFIIYISQLQ